MSAPARQQLPATRDQWVQVLTIADNDPQVLAEHYHVSVRTIYRYMKRHGIKRRLVVAA